MILNTVFPLPHYRDAEGEKFHGDWEEAKADFKQKHLYMSALQLMKTGDVSGAVGRDDNTDNRGEPNVLARSHGFFHILVEIKLHSLYDTL